jgi:hypothetical protein
MISHEDWNLILTTTTAVVGIIVGIETIFGRFTYPSLWIGYGIFVFISIWVVSLIIRERKRKQEWEKEWKLELEREQQREQQRKQEWEQQRVKNKLVDLVRLPEPTTNLIAREAELVQLDEAFKDPKKAIVAVIAGGGVGKSALIWEWLQRLEPDYGGATRVFAWSFYRQGSHQKLNSSTSFFEEALRFFDYEGPNPKDEIEKARALAKCLRDHLSLLLLDGLEPLQHPVHIQGGEIADVALKELFRCIRFHRLGESGDKNLVIIATRQPIIELQKWDGYVHIDLGILSTQEGVKLLQSLNVKGNQADLEKASHDMGGHALGLVLMGRLLEEHFQGDIQCRDQLQDLFKESQVGEYTLGVLHYYDNKYWQPANFIQRIWHRLTNQVVLERILLRLMGLFERPMGIREKQILVERAEYAKPLAQLTRHEWRALEQRLEQAGLLLKPEHGGERHQWDTHPLIRQYFGQTFRERQPKAYQQAQQVLFNYYQSVPKKHQPDRLEKLDPLYRAVVHGCLAGEYQKAWQEVYIKRICRGDEHHANRRLGAYAHDLAALSAFFPDGWDKPVTNALSAKDQALLLGQASFNLMSLGRLFEAIKPRQLEFEILEQLASWSNAAVSARNLVDLQILIGELDKAEQVAWKAITYATRAQVNPLFSQMASHAKLATVLHRQGKLNEALEQFTLAEKLQAKRQTELPQLYSVWGFQSCSLLLDQSPDSQAQQAILNRGQYALEIATQNNQPLDIALNLLTIACAQNPKVIEPSEQLARFDEAVLGIRRANKMNFLPAILLARANFSCFQSELKAAERDLEESYDIIQTCGMKLYQVDTALLRGNLNLDQMGTATECYKTAETLIALTGYHLRDPELDLLGARIAFSENNLDKAKVYLQKARERLEEMGYWGLLPVWEWVKREF